MIRSKIRIERRQEILDETSPPQVHAALNLGRLQIADCRLNLNVTKQPKSSGNEPMLLSLDFADGDAQILRKAETLKF